MDCGSLHPIWSEAELLAKAIGFRFGNELPMRRCAFFFVQLDLCGVRLQEFQEFWETGKHRILLEPYGYRWYRVGGVSYVLTHTDV